MAMSKGSTSYIEEMLTCSVCLELVKEPQTLAQCFHNYCKLCIELLMKSQNNQPPGIVCPLCDKFSAEVEVRKNFFVYDLLGHHSNADCKEGAPQSCEHCPEDKPPSKTAWRCLDCCSNFCQSCKEQHGRFPMLKGHNVVELTEDMAKIIDKLVLCTTHKDEPIKFFCKECREQLCNTCQVVNHSSHDIITVKSALDSILPEVKEDLKLLDGKNDQFGKDVENIDIKISDLEETRDKCLATIDSKVKKKIAMIIEEQKKMEDTVKERANIQVEKLQNSKNELTNQKKEINSLKQTAVTSMERAAGVSLLTQLTEGGLKDRLHKVSNETVPLELQIESPEVDWNDTEWDKLVTQGLLGRVVFGSSTVVVRNMGVGLPVEAVENGWLGLPVKPVQNVGEGSPVDPVKNKEVGLPVDPIQNMEVGLPVDSVQKVGMRYWQGDFTQVFGNLLRQTLEIELPGYCHKITICDDKIWAPIFKQNTILLYNTQGQLERSIGIGGQPVCVEKSFTGEILVCCSDTGLFVLSEDNKKPINIDKGKYSDMCAYTDKLYTWDWRNKQIAEFVRENIGWKKQGRVVYVGEVGRTSNLDTLVIRQCEGEKTKMEFFLALYRQNTVVRVTEEGQVIRQYQGQARGQSLVSKLWGMAQYRASEGQVRSQYGKSEICGSDRPQESEGQRKGQYRGSRGIQVEGSLQRPRLCGVDSQNQLLVADGGHCKYKLVTTDTGVWTPVFTGDDDVIDVTIQDEHTMWLCRRIRNTNVIQNMYY